MDTKRFEALVTAIRTGSFTKAAVELGYTQSGMTHMMSKLENEIGFPLFIRGHYGVELTKEGQELLPDILTLLKDEQTLQTHIDRIHASTVQSISLACYPSLSTHWLPHILQAFNQKMPHVGVTVTLGGVYECYNALLDGKVDLVLGTREFSDKVDWTELRRDPLVAVLPLDEETATLTEYPIERFNNADFLMPYMGFDLDINRALALRDAKPNIKPIRLDDPAIIAMVEHGWGVSIMSELILDGRTEKVRSIPLTPNCTRCLGIATAKSHPLNEYTAQWIETAIATVQQLYQSNEE